MTSQTLIEKTSERLGAARGVERLVNGQFVMDGAGVKINRVLTQSLHIDSFGRMRQRNVRSPP